MEHAGTSEQVEWRGDVGNDEFGALHAEAFGHAVDGIDRVDRLERWSLGWVTARDGGGALVGFVNVAWDGGVHAVLLDTCVAASARGRGLGVRLVGAAVAGARDAGCAWLHVDFADELAPFYVKACGFRPTAAGLIAL